MDKCDETMDNSLQVNCGFKKGELWVPWKIIQLVKLINKSL